MFIQDGKGRGTEALVTSRQRLGVNAITHTGEAQAAVLGKSFLVHNDVVADTLTIGQIPSTGGYVMTLKNTSATDTLVISTVFACSSVGGTVMQFDRNPTITTLVRSTAATPVNTDFRSGVTAEASAAVWTESSNGMGGITQGTILNTFILNTGLNAIPVDESFLMGKDDVLAMRVNPGTTAAEGSFSVRFHYIRNEEVSDLS